LSKLCEGLICGLLVASAFAILSTFYSVLESSDKKKEAGTPYSVKVYSAGMAFSFVFFLAVAGTAMAGVAMVENVIIACGGTLVSVQFVRGGGKIAELIKSHATVTGSGANDEAVMSALKRSLLVYKQSRRFTIVFAFCSALPVAFGNTRVRWPNPTNFFIVRISVVLTFVAILYFVNCAATFMGAAAHETRRKKSLALSSSVAPSTSMAATSVAPPTK
jgi:predicted outer membrane lipoprotein